MRKRSITLILIVVLVLVLGAGFVVSRGLASRSGSTQVRPVAETPTDGLSRAMTFTPPAEPAK